VATSPERTRAALAVGRGCIFEIDQTQHASWLDLDTEGAASIAWSLRFDVVASSPRRARDAIDVIADPDEVAWRVHLAGTATVEGATLVPTLDRRTAGDT